MWSFFNKGFDYSKFNDEDYYRFFASLDKSFDLLNLFNENVARFSTLSQSSLSENYFMSAFSTSISGLYQEGVDTGFNVAHSLSVFARYCVVYRMECDVNVYLGREDGERTVVTMVSHKNGDGTYDVATFFNGIGMASIYENYPSALPKGIEELYDLKKSLASVHIPAGLQDRCE